MHVQSLSLRIISSGSRARCKRSVILKDLVNNESNVSKQRNRVRDTNLLDLVFLTKVRALAVIECYPKCGRRRVYRWCLKMDVNQV